MRAILVLILAAAVIVGGGLFYFADKADKSAPEPRTIRVEAENVGP